MLMKEKLLTGRDFENLFREYFRSLTVYAMQFVNDQGIAEDIVQDLYLNLYEKWESNQSKTLTRNYLYKSVYNRCLNYLEFQKTRVENIQAVRDSLVSNPSDPLEIVAFVEFEHKFLQILEMLSPKCRKIFEMSRIEHKKNQEIADELKLSKRTVETHITRALKIMRKKLCKYLPIALIFFFFKVFFFTCGFVFDCYY
jgi:RNA polymerase sigma-70 factor (ECF subfamily)